MSNRADLIGSLLRPPDPEHLRGLEDQHDLRVVARQRELGLALVMNTTRQVWG
ncbi:MAG: hypothetical protein MK365_02320 [Vicinamibacterales bacterium]|jgi:hypothetical protein|nr:hypothetical protein [Vicinamibacterales bacterium]MEE2613616.1 hypothetical protein [Acidobacteriota bacterium]